MYLLTAALANALLELCGGDVENGRFVGILVAQSLFPW